MIVHQKNYQQQIIGSKARNLFYLTEHHYLVPPFFCITEPYQEADILEYLTKYFPDTPLFSVRSSASEEDSKERSFAGLFQTFLYVKREDVCARIQEVLDSAKKADALPYGSSSVKMHVIIQEMVEADISGILFTANPQGLLNESVMVLGAGSGELVVEDKVDTTTYYYHLTDKTYYYEQAGTAPILTDKQIDTLITFSKQIKALFKMECDIEFAIKDEQIYFLQVRPVTTLSKQESLIILDNSNIVESYPGITLPLTQSFIRTAYYQVFKNLLLHLTGEPRTVQQIDDTLQHMVDMANGRVYYRISNWYDVLLFLPFYRRIIPVWQEMMGVRDKTISSGMQHKISFLTRVKVTISFFRFLITCPKKMRQLDRYFAEIISHFASQNTHTEDNLALLSHYHSLLEMTVKRWDITLVNDMYAFLFTGLLKAYLKIKKIPDYENVAKQAISGISQLESLAPVKELSHLVACVMQEGRVLELQKLQSNQDYQKYIEETKDTFTKQLELYIEKYGDRNIEELKLESKTFRTDPILLIRHLLSCVEHASNIQASARDRTYVPSKKLTGLSAFFAKRAALGISNREKSRLHRSRLYGMMRTLVLQIGSNLQTQGRIAHREDIFWLDCEEIEQAAKDSSVDLETIIARRKEDYQGYSALPAYSRLVFSGKIFDKHPQKATTQHFHHKNGIYFGTACSQGNVKGEVLLVTKPSLSLDTQDKILVTKMTDPGWVFLIASAKGIVAEKGSLLSHTAIISRELGRPSIVGIPHITEILKDGDIVEVDGDTGTLTILSSTTR